MLLLLFLHLILVAAAQDIHAFPKYSLTFLHANPVDNITAQRWLRDGIHSDREFQYGAFHTIDAVDDMAITPALEHLRLAYKSYICLIPPPPTLPPSSPPEDTPPVPPSHTWSLLQPLSDTCLYVSLDPHTHPPYSPLFLASSSLVYVFILSQSPRQAI